MDITDYTDVMDYVGAVMDATPLEERSVDPQMVIGQFLPSMCLLCKHLDITEGAWTCPAFPTGIPEELKHGTQEMDHIPDIHLEPHELQEGDTVFEKDEGVTDEMVKEWDGYRAQLLIIYAEIDGLDLEDEENDEENKPLDAREFEELLVELLGNVDFEVLGWMPEACRTEPVTYILNQVADAEEPTDYVQALVGTAGCFAVSQAWLLARDSPGPRPLADWTLVMNDIATQSHRLAGLGMKGLNRFRLDVGSHGKHVWQTCRVDVEKGSALLAFYVYGALAQGDVGQFTGVNFAVAAMMGDLGVTDLFHE